MKRMFKTSKILKVDGKSLFKILLGFSPNWDDTSNQKCFSEKFISLDPKDTVHLKCNCINDSILIGVGESILYCFNLNKPAGYKVYFETKTTLHKRLNEPLLSHNGFHLEVDKGNKVDVKVKTQTITL